MPEIALASSAGGRRSAAAVWVGLVTALAAAAAFSLGVGRFNVPVGHVLGIIASWVIPLDAFWTGTEARVVEAVRAPRILLAVLGGAGLAISGAALQGTFRNPLVAPNILGVSSGAAFGGALGLLMTDSGIAVMGLAFLFGLAATALVFWLGRIGGRSHILTLVLSGIVVGAFFSALVTLVTFVADPYDKLPAIVFWLMGSFAAATHAKVLLVLAPVLGGSALLFLLRWRINVLSLGDEEAQALGLSVEGTRWLILLAVAAITASMVAVSGIIGWVGLVIPHFARILVGADHRRLLPASALLGGGYLLLIDNVARAATAAEIPIGVLTAVVGAPVFAFLLRRNQARDWSGA